MFKSDVTILNRVFTSQSNGEQQKSDVSSLKHARCLQSDVANIVEVKIKILEVPEPIRILITALQVQVKTCQLKNKSSNQFIKTSD